MVACCKACQNISAWARMGLICWLTQADCREEESLSRAESSSSHYDTSARSRRPRSQPKKQPTKHPQDLKAAAQRAAAAELAKVRHADSGVRSADVLIFAVHMVTARPAASNLYLLATGVTSCRHQGPGEPVLVQPQLRTGIARQGQRGHSRQRPGESSQELCRL